ncbi:MAG: nucleotidyltransferase domain-containing protein [Anaerolineales bacterium]|nr:nucleotidyltransferase domain-containing protein [Anaerolineales bacterium]
MLAEPLLKNRDEILRIAARHGAFNVRIFGSQARGETKQDSDLDLLVEVGPDRSPWFPAGMIADLEELLGYEVDVVTSDSLHWFVRDQIL